MNKTLLSLALGAVAFGAHAVEVRGIYSNVTGASNNAVPGTSDIFAQTFTFGSTMVHAMVSPDGNNWMFFGFVENGTDDARTMIKGSGINGAAGTVLMKQGQVSFYNSPNFYTAVRQGAAIDDAGNWAIPGITGPVAFTTSSTGTNEFIAVKTVSGPLSLFANQGSPSPVSGVNHGTALGNPIILDNGSITYRATSTAGFLGIFNVNGATTTEIIRAGATASSPPSATIPTNQAGTPQQLRAINTDGFMSDKNSLATQNFVYVGSLLGPVGQDSIFAVNNRVVLQEGQVPTALGFTSSLTANTTSTVTLPALSHDVSEDNGYFVARAALADGISTNSVDQTDFVVFGKANGTAAPAILSVVKTGDPIIAGSSETWSDDSGSTTTYSNSRINSYGDTIVCGGTSDPDAYINEVMVMNGRQVILRENDLIDVDGDGDTDENIRLGFFNTDDIWLTDNNYCYFIANVRPDGAAAQNAFVGSVFGRIKLPLTGDTEPDDEVGPGDLQLVLDNFGQPASVAPNADLDGDGEIGPGDLQIVLDNFGRSR